MARFDQLDALGQAVGDVYADCVDRLLVNLARHFKYLKPGEEPGGAFQYQAKKLAEFGQVNRESVGIIRNMLGGVSDEVASDLEQAILDALEDVEKPLRDAARAALESDEGAAPLPPPAPSPRAMRAFQLYHRQSADRLNLVNTTMLQSTAQAYRSTVSDITSRMLRAQSIVNAASGEVIGGAESFNQALRLATDRLLEMGLTGFVDAGGRNWQPETFVAMTMRSTYHNVSREAFWERNEDYGNDLYLVSQHPGARPLCYPWQCKVISRTDKPRDMTDGAGRPVRVYAQSETTYGEPAGLFGINCGHHPELFIPGVTKVPEVRQDEQENAQTYAQSQRQRRLEREFRKARLEYATAKAQDADDETLKRARKKLEQADQRLDAFEKETGRRRRQEREYQPVQAKWPKNEPKSSVSAQKSPESTPGTSEVKNASIKGQTLAEKPLTDEAKHDTLSAETKDAGDGVKKLCDLKPNVFEKEFGELNTSEVVITDERVQHIQEHHPVDYSLFEKYGKKTVEDPDIIIRDIKNEGTVFLVSKLDNTNLNTIVRLSVAELDNPNLKNSVMTFYRIRTKNLEKLMAKHKVLYKKQEE